MVIDDAHLLPAAAIRLLDDRLSSDPQSLRMLLISRWDLPITRLGPQLLGHFTVLRGDVLRLNEHDSAALIAEHARTSSAAVARAVSERTQGWCAAVVLAARAIASAPDPLAAAQRLHDQDTAVADAVASAVFASMTPRVRHLLLCVANEETVSVRTACHLTHGADCGALLADLETTGLLVTRLGDDPAAVEPSGQAAGRASVPGQSARYRIHPLLAEVVRRRLAAGGVDVERARATVLRAVRLDLDRGERGHAFDRLVALNHPAAADVLADNGHDLLMSGGGEAVRAFARTHPRVLEDHPDAWFTMAMERWFADDLHGAMHWVDRLLQAPPREGRGHAAEIACLRLLRARLGLEPAAAAITNAQGAVTQLADAPLAILPRLLGELGVTQNWLGGLAEAELNLTEAIRVARAGDLPTYAAEAMTHLSMTFYCQGRERACVRLATEALDLLAGVRGWQPRFTEPRARLAIQLATMADLPWPDRPTHIQPTVGPIHSADHTARFWTRMRDARLALTAGQVGTAQRTLTAPTDIPPPLPRHLNVALAIERACLAVLAGDERALAALISDLDTIPARAESSLLRGLRADLRGDLPAAAVLFAAAARAEPIAQPPCRALALVCEAQLLDELGARQPALDALRHAVTITEVRGNATPFLGWTRHGSSVHRLLTQLVQRSSTPWLHDLTAATAGPSITAVLGPWASTTAERQTATPPVAAPELSPRERDVLHHLARGATYSDMAANLFVSENTVKSHVSSLYAKLAVRRRSEALAAARRLELL